jgi:hypothetical protein
VRAQLNSLEQQRTAARQTLAQLQGARRKLDQQTQPMQVVALKQKEQVQESKVVYLNYSIYDLLEKNGIKPK